MEECCGINLEQEMTIENLYCFIRASLQALQSTGGYGEADFVCPLCGKKAHIKRLRASFIIQERLGAGAGIRFAFNRNQISNNSYLCARIFCKQVLIGLLSSTSPAIMA